MHEHDADGRLIRSVTEREPEWDEEQLELITALSVYEAGLGPHGLPLAETMSDDADPDNPNGKYRYVATKPRRDWYEYAVEQEQSKDQWSGDNYLHSRKFHAVRVDRG